MFLIEICICEVIFVNKNVNLQSFSKTEFNKLLTTLVKL
jgi:hypothetical protein